MIQQIECEVCPRSRPGYIRRMLELNRNPSSCGERVLSLAAWIYYVFAFGYWNDITSALAHCLLDGPRERRGVYKAAVGRVAYRTRLAVHELPVEVDPTANTDERPVFSRESQSLQPRLVSSVSYTRLVRREIGIAVDVDAGVGGLRHCVRKRSLRPASSGSRPRIRAT